jgi:hypothetical protein
LLCFGYRAQHLLLFGQEAFLEVIDLLLVHTLPYPVPSVA